MGVADWSLGGGTGCWERGLKVSPDNLRALRLAPHSLAVNSTNALHIV